MILHVREGLPGKPTQKKFADMLGVKRTTASAWERAQNVPSVAVALRIAGLMPDPRSIASFLDLVGVDQRATADLVADLDGKHFVAPKEDQVANILPTLETASSPHRLDSDLHLQFELSGSPSSKRYFAAPAGASTLGFAADDVLVLDVSAVSLRSPAPFWGRRVLVEIREQHLGPHEPAITYEVGRLVLDGPYLGPSGNFYAAALHLWSDAPPRPSVIPGLQTGARTVAGKLRESGREAMATLAEQMEPSYTAENLGYAMPTWLGTWESGNQGPQAPKRREADGGSSEAERARSNLLLKPGYRILGRVIAWIEPQGRASKKS